MEFSYLNAIPSALIAIDRALCVQFINPAAEMLFGVSAPHTKGRELSTLPAITPELCALCERVFASGEELSLFGQELVFFYHQRRAVVTIHLTPVMVEDKVDEILITIEKADGLDRLAANESKQEATRAAGIMAAMLAHEVKNPLSGIRGAAQLLRDEVAVEQQPLTDLICMETDRIRDLLDQVEIFAAGAPEGMQPVNIHEVLQYVISIAQTGFAAHVTFKERYDPSLPPVLGHRDLLVQLFLNLVKNAAEAMAGQAQADMTISTAYRSGSHMRVGQAERVSLPIAVTIEDNGPGIPEAVRPHLFEPFISSKEEGRGLGLAIVAKITSDLGAVVELDKECEGGTRFVVWLAVDSR